MKNIEIKTTQNVTLEYEVADLRDRIIAYLIDLVVITVAIMLFSVLVFGLIQPHGTSEVVYVYFMFGIFIFYTLVMETLNNGQSLGKMAMKIQVIKTAGGRATFSDYTARWVFRMIDIYFSFGGVASILIASSSKAQRIGDVVANTAVIKLTHKMDLRLADLLEIETGDSYTPNYPEAKQLLEVDVLLVQNALNRRHQFANEASEEALALLSVEIKKILGVRSVEQTDRQFLQSILKDYVVLTR